MLLYQNCQKLVDQDVPSNCHFSKISRIVVNSNQIKHWKYISKLDNAILAQSQADAAKSEADKRNLQLIADRLWRAR